MPHDDDLISVFTNYLRCRDTLPREITDLLVFVSLLMVATLKGKNLLSLESKFFPLRVAHI